MITNYLEKLKNLDGVDIKMNLGDAPKPTNLAKSFVQNYDKLSNLSSTGANLKNINTLKENSVVVLSITDIDIFGSSDLNHFINQGVAQDLNPFVVIPYDTEYFIVNPLTITMVDHKLSFSIKGLGVKNHVLIDKNKVTNIWYCNARTIRGFFRALGLKDKLKRALRGSNTLEDMDDLI